MQRHFFTEAAALTAWSSEKSAFLNAEQQITSVVSAQIAVCPLLVFLLYFSFIFSKHTRKNLKHHKNELRNCIRLWMRFLQTILLIYQYFFCLRSC